MIEFQVMCPADHIFQKGIYGRWYAHR